jgi:hypothetical protein
MPPGTPSPGGGDSFFRRVWPLTVGDDRGGGLPSFERQLTHVRRQSGWGIPPQRCGWKPQPRQLFLER